MSRNNVMAFMPPPLQVKYILAVYLTGYAGTLVIGG
jgi:hypothetical protein